MIGNGLGPRWFPEWLRSWLTSSASYFFKRAAWEQHDEGYAQAIKPRWHCDFRFLQEMLKDAADRDRIWKIFVATTLAFFFWTLVRCGGWMTFGR